MNFGIRQLEVFHILRKNFGFNPENDTTIYYHKKIRNNEITIEELPEILNRNNLPKSEKMKKDFNINFFEKKIFSQNGEDGIIEFIFSTIGTSNKFFVEFGVKDGSVCNTRYLMEKKNWKGLMMDNHFNQSTQIKREFITAENINDLFKKYKVPLNFDLLSIDIDFNDYWVWQAIKNYSPRCVVIEYNSSISSKESKVVKYDPRATWDKTNYFGASLLALCKLGKKKGYDLVGCDSQGINAFFIKSDIISDFIRRDYSQLYRPPQYGLIVNGKYIGFPPSEKEMIKV